MCDAALVKKCVWPAHHAKFISTLHENARHDRRKSVIKHNGRLDGRLVADALERLAELFQLEGLVDDALGLDLARVEVVDRLGCVCFSIVIRVKERKGGRLGRQKNVRNMWTSEKDPMIRSSSPKILDGGQVTRAALA